MPANIALLCDERGMIQKVLQDDMGLPGLSPGQHLGQLVDSNSRIKLLNFLVELRAHDTAFGWEINILKDSQVVTLSLAGAMDKTSLLIVFTHSPLDALNLLNELVIINFAQNTPLQTAVDNQIELSRSQNDRDSSIYDEISRLNNDLITLQRDLVKQNAELERVNAINRQLVLELDIDLNNRKQAEIVLRESEERFREVLENSLDASYKRNLQNNTYDYLSPVFTQISGYKPQELQPMMWETMLSLTHPDDQAEVIRTIANIRSVTGDTAYRVEYRFKHNNGQYIWLQDQFIVVRDSSAQALATIGTMRNITHSKLLNEKMIQSQKLADLGTLAAGMAHEINSPLQVITGSSDSLLGKLEKGETNLTAFKPRLERISQNAWRIAEIVRAMLAYARSSNDLVTRENLNQLVRDGLLMTEGQFQGGSKIEIVTELAQDLPEFLCDRNKIIQVLINLLTNARDAMPEGGKLTIHSDFDSEAQKLILIVSDTGEGISGAERSKIFDPFFTTKPLGQGTGLGLSIAMGIVHSHGGEIKVESSPGQGSTFILSFALTPPSEEQNTPNIGRFEEQEKGVNPHPD